MLQLGLGLGLGTGNEYCMPFLFAEWTHSADSPEVKVSHAEMTTSHTVQVLATTTQS